MGTILKISLIKRTSVQRCGRWTWYWAITICWGTNCCGSRIYRMNWLFTDRRRRGRRTRNSYSWSSKSWIGKWLTFVRRWYLHSVGYYFDIGGILIVRSRFIGFHDCTETFIVCNVFDLPRDSKGICIPIASFLVAKIISNFLTP